jgi:hypothetical protein
VIGVFWARMLQASRGTATNFVVNFIASFVDAPNRVLTESAAEGPRSGGSCQLCRLLTRRLCRGLRERNDKVYVKAYDEGSFIWEPWLRLRTININRKVSPFSQDLTEVELGPTGNTLNRAHG